MTVKQYKNTYILLKFNKSAFTISIIESTPESSGLQKMGYFG